MVSLANHHDEAWDLSPASGISESTTCIYTPMRPARELHGSFSRPDEA
jgi:hypothetical protein